MSDQYPLYGNGYQPKSADQRSEMITQASDPVQTVMQELSALLLDQRTQLLLVQNGAVPVAALQPWLQELYARGKAEGYQNRPRPTEGEPTS